VRAPVSAFAVGAVMQVTTILVDELPKVVVRPVDLKALNRFLRNARGYLAGGDQDARISHRLADDAETRRWRSAFDLHIAWGGGEDEFFGVPL
jgi:hypothetical protein